MSEHLSTGVLARLYQAAFARVPDQGGLSYWQEQYEAGASLEAIAANFISSAEFQGLYSDTLSSNQAFVEALYANVLGRSPDAGGLAYWTERMDNGLTQAQTLAFMADSQENRENAQAFVIGSGDVPEDLAPGDRTQMGQPDLVPGNNPGATGTVTVGNHAELTVGYLGIAVGGGDGTFTAYGTNTMVTAQDAGLAASGGTGVLKVLEGADLRIGGATITDAGLNVGRGGATGNVYIDGDGSLLSIAAAEVPYFSLGRADAGTTATMEITNGGTFQFGGYASVGREGATGTLTVAGAGSTVTLEDQDSVGMAVGRSGGNGTVTLRDGATMTFTSPGDISLSVGGDSQTGGTGTIALSGEGTALTAGGWSNFGRNGGSGTLEISSGADVSLVGMSAGRDSTSTGTVTVTGAGSTLTLQGANPVDGTAPFLTIGRADTSQGTLAISDGGRVALNGGEGQDWVGLTLAREEGTSGTLTLSGAGTALTVDAASTGQYGAGGFMGIGRMGEGTVSVTEGATLANDSDGWTYVAGFTSGRATVTVDGAGSVWDAGQVLIVCGTVDDSTGAMNLDVGSEATITVTNGGTLRAGAAAGDGVVDVYLGTGATLNAANGGIIDADVQTSGGTFVPGNSPGIVHVSGDFTQTAGALELEIAGTDAGAFDQINADGALSLDGGVLELVFLDGFTLAAGDSVTLLTSGEDLSLAGDVSVSVAGVADDFRFSLQEAGEALVLTALTETTAADAVRTVGTLADAATADGAYVFG